MSAGFRDPAKGRKKQFKISYVVNGVARTNVVLALSSCFILTGADVWRIRRSGALRRASINCSACTNAQSAFAAEGYVILGLTSNKVLGNFALADELMTRYAPEVRLHREEQYFPSSIEWYLRLSDLCYNGKQGAMLIKCGALGRLTCSVVAVDDPHLISGIQNFDQLFQTITIGVHSHHYALIYDA